MENYNEHLLHDNLQMENEHFALVFAQAWIRNGTIPTKEMCENMLKLDLVNEQELELILETYEGLIDGTI